jgi:hypothetical protein
MVLVCEKRLKNWLNTAILAVAGGMVFGIAAFHRLSTNGRQIAP